MTEPQFPPAARQFIDGLGVQYPVIGGPMYPCSNPELVAAVSEAGGLGVMQPISLTYVHGHEFRQGIRLMRKLTDKPIDKLSRGTLTAEASFKLPAKIDDNTSCEVKTEILDESGDPVAGVRATWLLGFKHSA